MLEIEMKCPVADFAAVEQRLASWGIACSETRQEIDQYFKAPDRNFAATDEALRLRRIGPRNVLTYKGPKQAATAKTRVEIEVALAEGQQPAHDCLHLLEMLGYRPVAIVRKQRLCYHLERGGFELEVSLDRVEDVGLFVEVEIRASEELCDAAQQVLGQVLADLNLTATERRSYLELLLGKKAGGCH